MATITTEYGKLSSNKTRTVYLRIRSGKTEKRINTQVKVLESEISPRTKKIKDFSKARQIEMMRLDWEAKINQLGIEALGVKVDAQDITSAISKKEEETDFFAYAKNWLAHTSIKGKKTTTTLSSSNESSKKSLLECIVFPLGQPNTPESNISGLDRAVKEQARPLFMGIFAH